MTYWLVMLTAIGLFAGTLLVLRPLLVRLVSRAAARTDRTPIPAQWLATVERHVPAVRALDAGRRTRLLRAVRTLIATRSWEGCGGLRLTFEMQLVIAAQACVLTLELPGDPFPSVRSILVYPRAFVPRPARDLRKWLPASEPGRAEPESGESWSGIVVLGWEEALAGAANPADGENLVYHEFAHQLDFEHHLTRDESQLESLFDRGVTPRVPDPEAWQRALQQSYERFCARLERHRPAVLDRYAATDPAEFFAVATEVFFERPRALRAEYADLYDQLRTFYRQDPAGAGDE